MKPRHTKIGEYSAKSEPLPTHGWALGSISPQCRLLSHRTRVASVTSGARALSDTEKNFMKSQRKVAFFKALGVNGTNTPAVITHEDYILAGQYDWFCYGPRGNVARIVCLAGNESTSTTAMRCSGELLFAEARPPKGE